MSSQTEMEYYLRMDAIADTAIEMLLDHHAKCGYPDWLASLTEEYENLAEEFYGKYEKEG